MEKWSLLKTFKLSCYIPFKNLKIEIQLLKYSSIHSIHPIPLKWERPSIARTSSEDCGSGTEFFQSDWSWTSLICRNTVIKLKLFDLDPDNVLTWFPPLFGLTKTSSGFMSGEEIGFITNGRPLLSWETYGRNSFSATYVCFPGIIHAEDLT